MDKELGVQVYSKVELSEEVLGSLMDQSPFRKSTTGPLEVLEKQKKVLHDAGIVFYRDSDNGVGLVLENFRGDGFYSQMMFVRDGRKVHVRGMKNRPVDILWVEPSGVRREFR